MRTSRGDCAFCGRPVLLIETAAWPVQGWMPERGHGPLVLPARVDDAGIAHLACAKMAADRNRRRISAGQGALEL